MERGKNKILSTLQYLLLILISFVSLFPFYWMAIGATNTTLEIAQGKLTPGTALLLNFSTLTNAFNLKRILFNTVAISFTVTFLGVFLSALAAYGFQLYRSQKRERLYKIFILSMMIPFTALMIPLYRMIITFRLLNSLPAVILPGLVSIFQIFFFRQNFRSFNREIVQAARIDGANEFIIFLKIVSPAMKNTYAAGIIFLFMTSWNSYLWPLIVLQSEKTRTLPLLISTISSSHTLDYGVLMLVVVISTIPSIILFFLLQRHFVNGMLGAVKQ